MRSLVTAGVLTALVGAVVSGCGTSDSSVPPSVAPPAAPVSTGPGPLNVVGLVGGTSLVSFSTDNVGIRDNRVVTGLVGDRKLVGIDYRVQDGKLYGVGDAGGVYTVNDAGAATKVKQLSTKLSGTNFGVDFNPAANALRVVSDNGQNLRTPFGTGDAPSGPTVVDGALNYMAVTANGVSGAGYTNNDLSATTATTLFDVDTALDQVAIQAPANAGSLSPTGKLGVDAGSNAGFDVYSDLRNGATVSNKGFATLSVGGQYRLYTVDLLTGSAQQRGALPGDVSDLAVDLDR